MRITHLGIPLAVALVANACHHAPPAETVAPQAQPADDRALRAHQDSIDAANRARAEAERIARERASAESAAAAARTAEQLRATLETKIHFAFDKANIRPEDVQILDQKLPVLQAKSQWRIRVAGHCDERGSDEYNLALGNRRAISAKQYLVSHGVDGSRIEVVSYGKEHPLDSGHNEAAWAVNRRDEFEILTPNVVLGTP
jgi:peptidoglycan-associated lipoprotein